MIFGRHIFVGWTAHFALWTAQIGWTARLKYALAWNDLDQRIIDSAVREWRK